MTSHGLYSTGVHSKVAPLPIALLLLGNLPLSWLSLILALGSSYLLRQGRSTCIHVQPDVIGYIAATMADHTLAGRVPVEVDRASTAIAVITGESLIHAQ